MPFPDDNPPGAHFGRNPANTRSDHRPGDTNARRGGTAAGVCPDPGGQPSRAPGVKLIGRCRGVRVSPAW